MLDIPANKQSFSYDPVPEFMVVSHTADVNIQTFMSEKNAIDKARALAEILPGHTFLVFGLVAEARAKTVDVDVRRVSK